MSKSVYEQALGAHRSVLPLITAHAVPCSCACGPARTDVSYGHSRITRDHSPSVSSRLTDTNASSRASCCSRGQPAEPSPHPFPFGVKGAFTYVLVSSEGVLTVTGSCRDETCGSPEITSRRLIAGALLGPRTWPGRDDGPCSPR